MKLDFPMAQKTPEEIRSRDGKTAFFKGPKQNNFIGTFIWSVFAFNLAPLNDSSRLKKMIIHKQADSSLRKLAFLPPAL